MSPILLLLPLLSLTAASPVLQPNLETDQDRFDLIDSLLGVTTTPKPGLFDWWPNNGGWFGFGLFGKTTTTTPPPTTTTTTTTTPPPTTTKCGGLLGGGLLFC